MSVNLREDTPHFSDEPIEIAFDQLLRPSSAVRQSFVIRDAFGAAVEAPLVTYDPVLRIVRIENPRLDQADENVRPWMLDQQPYTLTLGIPEPGEDTGGFVSIDEGKLSETSKRRWGFVARIRPRDTTPPAAESFCGDVLPLLQAKCGSCHGAARADMGLDLSSGEAIQRTAVGRLARLSANASSSRDPISAGRVFGRNMALVDPRSPGTSFLLYKTLLAAPAAPAFETPACGTQTQLIAPRVAHYAGLSDADRSRLAAYVGGDTMPPARDVSAPDRALPHALTLDEQRILSAWMSRGAPTPSCFSCAIVPP
ncbi:MAG: hypothetical protein U0174_06805 [Polyangiaceae bacterium]